MTREQRIEAFAGVFKEVLSRYADDESQYFHARDQDEILYDGTIQLPDLSRRLVDALEAKGIIAAAGVTIEVPVTHLGKAEK